MALTIPCAGLTCAHHLEYFCSKSCRIEYGGVPVSTDAIRVVGRRWSVDVLTFGKTFNCQ